LTNLKKDYKVTTPLISVIIPVYNTRPTLERCFNSVIAQTYPNLEFILVDDGSTDGAEELCDTLAAQDARVKVIHQKNQGLSAARNAGLKVAQGQYLTFIDSDDTVAPQFIATLYGTVQDHDVQLAICSFTEVFPDGKRRNFSHNHHKKPSRDDDTELLSAPEALVHMLCEDGFTMSAWGKLYARELFRDVHFPVGKLYEDVGTTYKLVLQCSSIAFIPWPGYNYYQNSNSIIHQEFRSSKLDLIALTDQMCDAIAASSVFQNASESERTKLDYALQKRRIHARFSILRQLSDNSPATKALQKELSTYIRSHADYITRNPLRTRRDLIALRAVQLGVPVFLLLWKIYAKR